MDWHFLEYNDHFSLHAIPKNVWLGVAVENQKVIGRIDYLKNWILRYGSLVVSLCWKTWEHLTCRILTGLSLAVSLVIEPERWKRTGFYNGNGAIIRSKSLKCSSNQP